jgi:hypothetical protein
MNNIVPLSVENMNLADAMGFSPSAGSSGSSVDLYFISTGVIQEAVEGKVVNSPVFKIKKGEDEFLCRGMSIRFFVERQRWQKWDSLNKAFQRTVMSTNLNADLKDTLGTFNLGRPSGYIKDFKALPKDQQDHIRNIDRIKVLMGLATFIDPFVEGGEPVLEHNGEVPVVFNIKNKESLKSIDATIAKLISKRISPVENLIMLSPEVRPLPNNGWFAVITAALGDTVGFSEGDNEVLGNFIDYVERNNEYVLNKWEENNVERISDEDAEIVANIVDVQDFE